MIYKLSAELYCEVFVEANSPEEALAAFDKAEGCLDHHVVDASEITVSEPDSQTIEPSYSYTS